MPRGDRTKAPAFRLWKAGKSLREIQDAIRAMSRTKPSSVAGWVRDWERGSQGTWTPRVRTVLVSLSLLTSAATAYAECAWVLWHGEQIGSFETTPLMAMGAWSDRKDCETVQEAKLKQFASDPYSSSMPRDPGIYDKIETLGNGVSVERYRKATGERFAIVVYRYLCLPDTVDARRPKGK